MIGNIDRVVKGLGDVVTALSVLSVLPDILTRLTEIRDLLTEEE